jgi:tetratricopeptide (TPR) repeat protein
MAQSFAGRSFLGTFGLIFLAMAALFVADMFLAKTERAESLVQARRLFAQGRVLMQRGDNAEAIERIKDAISIARGNREYQRTLAMAQFAAGKNANAESTLAELLESDSTDGLASLIMGRVLVKEGRVAEGISYYHRAIYGDWNEDAAGNRLRVRFELIDLLAERNSKEELLAELLPVQDNAPHDVKTQTRIGRLFLLAGSASHAAAVFRGILHDAPGNANAYAGLGEAEFTRGNYRVAQREFQTALRLDTDDPDARQHLDLCDKLLLLDPTMRGLGMVERYRRSLHLVELTLADISQCIGTNPPPELQGLLDNAAKALKAPVRAAHQGEVAESNLDLAEQLWQARKKECKAPPAGDTPLALVLARLAQ